MRRDDEGAGHRHARLQDLILEELRALLRDDVSDPALGSVRIIGVVLSVDYRQARVHFATLGGDPEATRARAQSERALVRATAFLRARLADALDLKRVPDLRFLFHGTVASDAADEGNEGGGPCSA
jgi:ribosome-binding factor A